MRVLIADDHDLVRDTLAAFLRGAGYTVSTASNLDDAVQIVKLEALFDLVLLDYSMPGMAGLQGLDKMLKSNNGRPVAIISGTASKSVANDAIALGARGFIPKTITATSLVNAVKFIIAGETYLPSSFIHGADDTADLAAASINLTSREREVLACICQGKSNKEIAIEYNLQEITIKVNVTSLMAKLGAKNRTHAAMIARDLKIV